MKLEIEKKRKKEKRTYKTSKRFSRRENNEQESTKKNIKIEFYLKWKIIKLEEK